MAIVEVWDAAKFTWREVGIECVKDRENVEYYGIDAMRQRDPCCDKCGRCVHQLDDALETAGKSSGDAVVYKSGEGEIECAVCMEEAPAAE